MSLLLLFNNTQTQHGSVGYEVQPNPWEGEPLTGPLIDAIQNALVQIVGIVGQLHLTANSSSIYSDSGAPGNAIGVDGDYYFRKDGSAGAHIYFKSNNAWAAIV